MGSIRRPLSNMFTEWRHMSKRAGALVLRDAENDATYYCIHFVYELELEEFIYR